MNDQMANLYVIDAKSTGEFDMGDWEQIDVRTQRLKVSGGWIYKNESQYDRNSCMVFVPESDKCSAHGDYLVKVCKTCSMHGW